MINDEALAIFGRSKNEKEVELQENLGIPAAKLSIDKEKWRQMVQRKDPMLEKIRDFVNSIVLHEIRSYTW